MCCFFFFERERETYMCCWNAGLQKLLHRRSQKESKIPTRGPCGCFSSWAAGGGSERESSRQQVPGPHGIAQILSLSTWDLQFQILQHQQQLSSPTHTAPDEIFDCSSCQTDNKLNLLKKKYHMCQGHVTMVC